MTIKPYPKDGHIYFDCATAWSLYPIAFDDDGNRAAAMGGVPEKARGQGLTATYITEQMFKTGGTPYNCVENRAQAEVRADPAGQNKGGGAAAAALHLVALSRKWAGKTKGIGFRA